MLVEKIYISYLTARKADPAIIYFYQHIVPKGTKIERNYFQLNIIFFTLHPAGLASETLHGRHFINRVLYTSRGMVLCIARRAFISIEQQPNKPALLPAGWGVKNMILS
ncbi:MAG: hypothetical protein LBM08_09055 [Dysgonamonadaceae bacterium]|jgi:hypothetical protein|nr:hypothetical protein [Dysgonamonadaceae bacterium]